MADVLLLPPPSEAAPDKPASRRFLLWKWLAGEPLVPPALGMAAGVLVDARHALPSVLVLVLFALAAAATLAFRRRDTVRHSALMAAALAAGAWLHDAQFRHWPADHIIRCCGDEPVQARLTGVVLDSPQLLPRRTGRITWFEQAPRTRFLLAASSIEGLDGPLKVSGMVSVTVREPLLEVAAGDCVEVSGLLHRPAPPDNPGGRDWVLAARRSGVLLEISCEHAANVRVAGSRTSFAGRQESIRRRAWAALREDTFTGDVPGSRLLATLVLGQRSAVDEELNQAFINTGTVHYLSVSGAHVGALALAVWAAGWLVGAARRDCAGWAAVLIVAYALLAEPGPAITRSAVMAVLLCAAVYLRRPVRSANSLAAAALVLLILQPTQLFDPGFQLSFLTLLAVIYLSPRIHAAGHRLVDLLLRRDDPLLQPEIQRMLNPPSRARRYANEAISGLAWLLSVSVAAWLAGVLLGAYHFRQFAPWGWLNSVLITVPMTITLILGLVKTVLTAIHPPLGVPFGWALAGMSHLLIAMVRALSDLPGSGMLTPELPAWLAAAGMTVLACWALAPWLRLKTRWIAGAMILFAATAACRLAPDGPGARLRMHVLSVGDGTACVLRLPGGRTWLYDLGTRPPYDLVRWTLGPMLAHERIYSIDALVLSHPQLDHFSGVPDLLDRVPVRRVITAPHFLHPARPGGPADRIVAELRNASLPWQQAVRGDVLAGEGDLRIEVLWPPPIQNFAIPDDNNASLVLRITWAGRRILLCGDIEETAQNQLVAAADLKADVLLLPHHGGVVRTTRDFIAAVDPEVCIRSAGRRDRDTTNGLIRVLAGRTCFNTADRGAVEVCVDPSGITATPFRARQPLASEAQSVETAAGR